MPYIKENSLDVLEDSSFILEDSYSIKAVMKNFEEPTFTHNRILTVPQAAEQLQVSERTVYEWLRDGKLPGRKIGKVWRLSAEAINEFVRGDIAIHNPQEHSTRP